MTDSNIHHIPQAQYLSGGFSDIDAFSEATQGWDLDFHQLDEGALEAKLGVIMQADTHFMRFQFSRSFHQRQEDTITILSIRTLPEQTINYSIHKD